MIDLDEMKRDMEAGTKGPWSFMRSTQKDVKLTGGSVHMVGFGDSTPYAFVSGLDVDAPNEGTSNARRIARVPDMEAAIIAQAATIEALRAREAKADELAEQCADLGGANIDAIRNALAAYRATGGAA